MKKLLTLAVAAAMTLSVAAASATTLKLSEVHAEGYPTTLADQEFARLIEEKTEGRIKVEVYSGGQLYGEETGSIEALQLGDIAFARVSASPVASYVPALNAIQMPYLYKNADHMWAVLDGEIGQDMLAQIEASGSGLVGLCWYDAGARSYYTTKKVASVADMKGLKIRMQNNAMMVDMTNVLGGTGVTGIFWDPAMRGGIGDIAVRSVNLLMLYWEPGVADIQASPDFFSLSLEDTARLCAQYPQLAGHTASVLDVPRYIHDEGQDTSSKSVVVDWYYKRPDETGRMVLHYCKFCNGVVLYARQNDPALAESGLYDHGQYPFVFDPLFVEEDSPAGFGYIDVMKDCQTAIDKMNHAMDENVLLSAKQRYVLSDTAGVNEEELADFSRDIVHVVGRLNDDSFRPLQTAGLQGNSLSYRQSRIEELKEISGNRDMTQGGTAGGVTAASAIAALQEAGSKLSRDMLKSAYRAFAKQCYLIIELMRQFYDEQRVFRIVGESGESRFVPFSAQALRAVPGGSVGGVELGSREPIFDIVVSAAKKSTFSRLSQNETAKECYQLGFFKPENADAALAALEMMDFEGIEKVRQRVRQNGTLAQQLARMQQQMAQMAAVIAQQGTGPDEPARSAGGASAQKDGQAVKLAGLGNALPVAAAARAMDIH